MSGWLSRLLFGTGRVKPQRHKPKLDSSYDRAPADTNKLPDAVKAFLSSIEGVGHSEYPLLSKIYSPTSRVPCTDIASFITNRIIYGDIRSIHLVMCALKKGTSQLEREVNCVDETVEEILCAPFSKYVSFSTMHAFAEIKSMFIMAPNQGAGREFLMADEFPQLVAWACITHQPVWSKNLLSLAERANSWIENMAQNAPYWETYGKFVLSDFPKTHIEENLSERLSNLTIAARLHLCYALFKGGGPLRELTNYNIRSFGINVEDTSSELVEAELVVPSCRPEDIASFYSKNELIELCERNGVKSNKSWNKSKLINSIKSTNNGQIESMLRSKEIISPNYEKFPALKSVLSIADEHLTGFKLLCFA